MIRSILNFLKKELNNTINNWIESKELATKNDIENIENRLESLANKIDDISKNVGKVRLVKEESKEVKVKPKKIKKLSKKERENIINNIKEVIQKNPQGIRLHDICKEVGRPINSVCKYTKYLTSKGEIILENGVYKPKNE